MEWRTFKLDSTDTKWFYTDETKRINIDNADWFNKNTDYVVIWIGYETMEYETKPISEPIKPMYLIDVGYHIANYFGDKSGCHYRDKWYVLKDNVLYKLNGYEPSSIVVRMTKELKGIMEYIEIRLPQSHWL